MNWVQINQMPIVKQIIAAAERKIRQATGEAILLTIATGGDNLSEDFKKSLRLRELVCMAFNVTWAQIEGKSRKTPIKDARHVYVYLAHKVIGISQSECARSVMFDSTTALHAIQRIDGFYEVGDSFTLKVETIKKQLLQ